MSRYRSIGAALSAFFLSATAHAAGPISVVNVGNWHGGSYTNNSTGVFDHCAVSAVYVSNILFTVSVSGDYSWRFGFTDNAWHMTVGQNIPVDLTFDGRGPYRVFAKAIESNFVIVEMPPTSEIVSRFRNALQMNAFTNGQLFGFSLKDTSIMLPALVKCVKDNAAFAAAPGPASAPLAIAPPVVASSPAIAANPNPPPASDLHDEAMELATNFILGARLDNPRVVKRSETPVQYASYGADWTATGALGSVRVIAGTADTKGIDVAAGVVAADAKECKGKFASARSSDMVDSEVVFRGFSSCEDSAGVRSVEYFIVPRKKGGFVLFSIVGVPSDANPSPGIPSDKLPIFQKAALTAAN